LQLSSNNKNFPICRNKTIQACSISAEYTKIKPALRTTQHEAEFGQECNEQSLSVSQAPIFPTLEQKSAKAAATLLMEHHLIALKYEI